jgi:putative transcription factor
MTDKQCEICGAEIHGTPQRIVIDGSDLEVCRSCARFGKPEDKWSPVSRKIVPAERSFIARPKPKPRDRFKEIVELVPDYGRKIRDARETQGLTPEALGLKIKEKAALIKKIEREEIIPEDDIRKKLEKELKIKLTEESGETKVKAGSLGKSLTLGDIANIKRK